MLKYLPRFLLSVYALIPFAAMASLNEVEGAIRSEHLIKYSFDPLPDNWENVGIKEKAKLGCQYAFERLAKEEDGKCKCEEFGVGDGATSGIYYKIMPKNDDMVQIPYAHPINSLRIFGWYHFRKDGKLPYYKKEAFKVDWIQEQCRKIKPDQVFDSLYIIPIVSVIDKNNDINLYVLGRNDRQLRLSSWVSNFAFSLFESQVDKLQSERCLLLQKLCLVESSKKFQERLDQVESELEALENEENTQ